MDWLINILIEILCPALGLIILAGLLIFWILKKKLPKENFLKLITCIFSGIIIFQSIFSTILNWWLWFQQGITKLLLPPVSPISYVLRYSWQHYWFEPIVVIFTAIIVFLGIYFLNKKFENAFFYDEEPYLASLGILATGWPNCLFYLSLVLFLGVLFHFIHYFLNGFARLLSRSYRSSAELGSAVKADRQNEMQRLRAAGARGPRSCEISEQTRLSLLYFWLPCALMILLLNGIISKYAGITQLSI